MINKEDSKQVKIIINQNQTNEGCGGCLTFIRDFFWGIVAIGFIGAFGQDHGATFGFVAGIVLGVLGGVKINNIKNGTSLTWQETWSEVRNVSHKAKYKWSNLKDADQNMLIIVIGTPIIAAIVLTIIGLNYQSSY